MFLYMQKDQEAITTSLKKELVDKGIHESPSFEIQVVTKSYMLLFYFFFYFCFKKSLSVNNNYIM